MNEERLVVEHASWPSATAQAPVDPHAIQVTADLAPSDRLTVRGPLHITPATGRGACRLQAVAGHDVSRLLEDLLLHGYGVRRGADAVDGEPMTFFVRSPPVDEVRLRTQSDVTVAAGTQVGFPVVAGGSFRLGRDAVWTGDVEASGDVWLEANARVVGSIRTPGLLTLEEGAVVVGATQVARLRFVSNDVFEPPATLPVPRGEAWPEPTPSPTTFLETPIPSPIPSPTPSPTPSPIPSTPVQSMSEAFDWDAPFPGRYRVVAKVLPAEDEIPKPLRAHVVPGETLEVEILASTEKEVTFLLHPGQARERRLSCRADEARNDLALSRLLPVLDRLTTLRMVYGKGVLGVRASADSIRWLITLFGKILSIESRLGRLEQMRIFTEPEPAKDESAFLRAGPG